MARTKQTARKLTGEPADKIVRLLSTMKDIPNIVEKTTADIPATVKKTTTDMPPVVQKTTKRAQKKNVGSEHDKVSPPAVQHGLPDISPSVVFGLHKRRRAH